MTIHTIEDLELSLRLADDYDREARLALDLPRYQPIPEDCYLDFGVDAFNALDASDATFIVTEALDGQATFAALGGDHHLIIFGRGVARDLTEHVADYAPEIPNLYAVTMIDPEGDLDALADSLDFTLLRS